MTLPKIKKRYIAAARILILATVYFLLRHAGITPRHAIEFLISDFKRSRWLRIVLLGLYVVRPVTLLPSGVITGVSSLLLGRQYGFLLAWVGELLGMMVGYVFGRFLFRGSSVALKIRSLMQKVHSADFIVVLLARLFFVSDDLVSYGSGMTEVSFKSFLLGSMIGNIPALARYIRRGREARRVIDGLGFPVYKGIIFILGMIVSGLAIVLYSRWERKHSQGLPQ